MLLISFSFRKLATRGGWGRCYDPLKRRLTRYRRGGGGLTEGKVDKNGQMDGHGFKTGSKMNSTLMKYCIDARDRYLGRLRIFTKASQQGLTENEEYGECRQ